jgi:tetratricopeptide (TPR) repeat protein
MSYAADGWLAEAEATAYVEACRGRESEVQLKEKQAKEGMERANAAQRAREAAELRAVRSRRDMWRLAGAAMVVLVAVLAWGWHRAAKESSARQVAMTAQTVAMAESNAGLSLVLYDKQKDRTYAKNAADFAKKALELNPRSDNAWFLLGVAELALKKHKEAVLAFDQVSPGSKLFADALNNAAAIDFDYLGDDQASYSRLTRAVQLKPDDMNVLSNYAESLLAAGHNDQAKLAAARARGPADAEVQGEAYVRAAMSFVMFSAELLSGNLDKALGELDEIDRHVKSAAAETKAAMEKGQSPQKWEYKGIRRSLERRLGTDSTEQRSALFTVITFIETNGKEGALDDMRRLVKTEPAKRYGSKNGIGVGLSKLEYPEN